MSPRLWSAHDRHEGFVHPQALLHLPKFYGPLLPAQVLHWPADLSGAKRKLGNRLPSLTLRIHARMEQGAIGNAFSAVLESDNRPRQVVAKIAHIHKFPGGDGFGWTQSLVRQALATETRAYAELDDLQVKLIPHLYGAWGASEASGNKSALMLVLEHVGENNVRVDSEEER